MPKTPEEIIREEIRALTAYPVPDSAGMVKLDAMENPYRLPPELRLRLARLVAEAELNRYPDSGARALKERLRKSFELPDGVELLLGNGSDDLIQVRDLREACALVNRIAPEHLELSVKNPDALLGRIRHAGAIFLGSYSSEALGDYCAGPNHVLPTSRTARFSSPLGVYDFQKRTSVIRVSRKAATTLGAVAAELARGEGLTAHAKSAEYRMKSFEPPRRQDAKKGTSR